MCCRTARFTQSTFGSGDTGDTYFVRFFGPGHPAGDLPVAVKTQRLRPFCTDDPSGGGSQPDEKQDHGEDAARQAAIERAHAILEEKTGVQPRPLDQRPRRSALESRTLSTDGGVPSDVQGNSESEADLSLDDESDSTSGSDEDQDDVSLWQAQRHSEGQLKKSDGGTSRQLQMRDRLRAILDSTGRIPRKRDSSGVTVQWSDAAAGTTGPVGASQQNSGLPAATSQRDAVVPHKETFATAALNAAQERRISCDQEPKRRKSIQSMVQCHRCGGCGHKLKDCTTSVRRGPGVVGTGPHAHTNANEASSKDSSRTDGLAKTHRGRRSGNGGDRHPSGVFDRPGSSYRDCSRSSVDSHRYYRRPTPLRRRSRSLDSRIDALRTDVLLQLGQQRRAGTDALNRYMDNVAAKKCK